MTPTHAAHLRAALDAHFDPDHGTPYWLDRERELGIDARRDIRDLPDLALLGVCEREAWIERPLRDFVPRSIWAQRTALVPAESGGTTGTPTRCVFTRDEFVEAFGAPYMAASAARGFPTGGEWLFVGPSGPHVIARAAELLAHLHGALAPYAIDLDPRWARAQVPGSIGARLYTRHVVEQVLDVLDRERVDTLFLTPPIALALGEELAAAARRRIRGIHLGGLPVTSQARTAIETAFPSAVVLAGYGNSMFGLLIEATQPTPAADGTLPHDYFPLPGRLVVRVVPDADGTPRLDREVTTGERGRVVLSRLDRSFLVVNHVERDRATRVAAAPDVLALGLSPFGVRDPFPVVQTQAVVGLY